MNAQRGNVISSAFTIIELMASIAIGLLVAGGAVVGLKNIVSLSHAKIERVPSWILQADRLLYTDLQQATRIEAAPNSLVIYTTSPADLFSGVNHERSVVTYEIQSVKEQQWWVREGRPQIVLSNKRTPGLLIGPASERVSLHIQMDGAPLLQWGVGGETFPMTGSWQVGVVEPVGRFRFVVEQAGEVR